MQNEIATRKQISMNVKGITPTLFEAGKVKIGRKGKFNQGQNGTWQQPEKLDHFLITRTIRGQDNNFIVDDALIAKFPKDQDGKLRRIPITLLYDSLDLNFQSRYACYIGKTLFCSGDGEEANQAIPNAEKKISGYKQVPCTCHRAEFGYEGRDKCKITGKLQFVIRGAERIGGVHVFRTTGRNSVVSILSSLAMIQRVTGGILAGIPLDLVVSPKSAVDPNGQQQTIQVVSVEFGGSMQALQETAHGILLNNAKYGLQIGRIEEEARALLTAQPAPFSDELNDDDREEFFPPNGATVIDMETGEISDPASQPTPQEPAQQPAPVDLDTAVQAAAGNAPAAQAPSAPVVPTSKPPKATEPAQRKPTSKASDKPADKPAQDQKPAMAKPALAATATATAAAQAAPVSAPVAPATEPAQAVHAQAAQSQSSTAAKPATSVPAQSDTDLPSQDDGFEPF